MNLDVVKTQLPKRNSSDSLTIIDKNLQERHLVRILQVERPTWRSIARAYGVDDWDVLMLGDYDDVAGLYLYQGKVFNSIPTILLCCATGVSCAVGKGDFMLEPFVAARELSNFLKVSEIWVISSHLETTTLDHYRNLFADYLVEEVSLKMRIFCPGIDLEEVESPRVVRKEPRIAFLHRPQRDKGLDDLLEYLSILALEGIKVTLVSHKTRSKIWREIEAVANVEFIPYLERQEYFEKLRGCDIVFSSALHENFGLAVLEAVALGCYPVIPNRLSYPEIFPLEVLYDCIEEAVGNTIAGIGTYFENVFVDDYLWKNIIPEWEDRLKVVHERFYRRTRMTPAGERIVDELRRGPRGKKSILKFLGWSSLMGWGKYRYMIKQKLPVSPGPHPIYGLPAAFSTKMVEPVDVLF